MIHHSRSVRTIAYALAFYLVGGCAPGAPLGPSGDGGSAPPSFTEVTPSDARVATVEGETIVFEARAESPAGLPVTITYTVDGTPRGSGTTFTFRPPESGVYDVEAIASDGERENRRSWTVEVKESGPPPNSAPLADLSLDPASGTAPLQVRVRLGGSDPDGEIVRYRLRLSGSTDLDIERETAIDTTLVLGEGSYQVEGMVEDDAGETTVSRSSISVDPPPNRAPAPLLEIDPTTGMAPLRVVVKGHGSDPDGEIVRYALDLDGDGEFDMTASSPLTQTFTYHQPGKVWVRLEVTDDDGAVSRDSLLVRVSSAEPANQAPTLSLDVTPESGEAPLTVHASATGADPDGSVASVEIDFDGDGVADASTNDPTLEADFTYQTGGAHKVRATVVDDGGLSSTRTVDVTVTSAPPDDGGNGGNDGGDGGGESNLSPTGSLAADRTSGDASLTVRLTGSGTDSDGAIEKWEIDSDAGDGFVEADDGQRTVVYAFRDTPYQPRLRITDDDGATTIVEGPTVTVHRPVDAANSRTSVDGNPKFDPYSIAPAMWADGKDALVFTIVVRDHDGNPLSDVPLRVRSTRQDLRAPDGTKLDGLTTIEMDANRTDGSGRLTGRITSLTSTRVEGNPEPGKFVPFGLRIEADAGHGDWRRLPDVTGLNVETLVDGDEGEGSFYVSPPASSGICVGDTVELHVKAIRRDDAPGAGQPAGGRYVEIRYLVGKDLLGVEPLPGYGSWRTDADGWIHFEYHVTEPNSKALQAWADGFPLNITAVIGASDCS